MNDRTATTMQADEVLEFTELEQAKLQASASELKAMHAQRQAASATLALMQSLVPQAEKAHKDLVDLYVTAARNRRDQGLAPAGNVEMVRDIGKTPRTTINRAGKNLGLSAPAHGLQPPETAA